MLKNTLNEIRKEEIILVYFYLHKKKQQNSSFCGATFQRKRNTGLFSKTQERKGDKMKRKSVSLEKNKTKQNSEETVKKVS